MTYADSDRRRFRIDAKTIVAGFLLPAVCFAVDFAKGGNITAWAPAGLLTLYLLGCAAIILPSMLDPHSRVWGTVAGALAAASIALCLLALPVSVYAAIAAYVGILTVGTDPGRSIRPLGFEALALSALGFSILWTARVFVRRAYFVLRTGVRVQGLRQSLGLGLFGAVSLAGVVYAADQIDRWWVTSQVMQISRANPSDWSVVLARLSAYPLCGRLRCGNLVCNRLSFEFSIPGHGGFGFPPEIATEQMDTLDKFFGGPALQSCWRIATITS